MNNRLLFTIDSFGEGTLANDMLASDYMESCGYTWGIIPNNASEKFSEMFMNSSFIRQVAFARLLNYTILYMQGSPWAQVGVKANYASSVVAQ